MKIRIITDSCCDIPLNYKLNNTNILGFNINVNGKDYEERKDFTFDEFYEILRTNEEIPKTAHITPIRYQEAYEDAVNNGATDIIVVTINKSASATYNAACLAKDMFLEDNDNVNITILDSAGYSGLYGWPIIHCDELISNGAEPNEVIDILTKAFDTSKIILGSYTLKYLKKSGRVSAAAAFAGEMMGFKPVILIDKGETSILQKVRGDKALIPAIINQLKILSNGDYQYILGYTNEQAGKELYAACERELPVLPYAKFKIGSSVTANTGPETLGFILFKK